MPEAVVTTPVLSREKHDCVVCALSTYLGVSYEDALRACCLVDPNWLAKRGLFIWQIKKAAVLLGTRLRYTKRVNLESDYGIVSLPDHVVVLRNGLVWEADPPGGFWDVEDYLAHYELSPGGILIARDDGTDEE